MSSADLPQILKLIAALVFVVSLMGGLAFILKKTGLGGPMPASGNNKRLRLIEVLPLDGRRKLVLLQRDDKQHLVILGASGETVVETDIKPKNDKRKKTT